MSFLREGDDQGNSSQQQNNSPNTDASLECRPGPSQHLNTSCHVPLNFGSESSRFQAPPFTLSCADATSARSTNSMPTSTVCSPRGSNRMKRSFSDMAQTPPATAATPPGATTDSSTPAATNVFSTSRSCSPSVSSVSSLRSRASFTNLTPLKIPEPKHSTPVLVHGPEANTNSAHISLGHEEIVNVAIRLTREVEILREGQRNLNGKLNDLYEENSRLKKRMKVHGIYEDEAPAWETGNEERSDRQR